MRGKYQGKGCGKTIRAKCGGIIYRENTRIKYKKEIYRRAGKKSWYRRFVGLKL
jgi:hypothetical protein